MGKGANAPLHPHGSLTTTHLPKPFYSLAQGDKKFHHIYMKNLLPSLLLAAAVVTPAFALETSASKLQLARQAVALNSPRDALMDGNTPLARQPMFTQVFNNLDFRKIDEQAAQLMTESFTTEEIRALVAFSNSDVGRSINLKMSGYQRLVGAMLQNEMKTTFERLMLTQGAQGAGLAVPKPSVVPSGVPGAQGAGSPIGPR